MKEMFLPQTDIVRWMDIADLPNEIWKDVTGYKDAFKHFSLKKEWSKDDMKLIKE